MSVVIVIITILLATIIISKVLIESAKLNKVNSEVRDIQVLTDVFRNTFDCLAGDCTYKQLPQNIRSKTPSGCFNLEADYITPLAVPIITTGFNTGEIDQNAKRTCSFYEFMALEPQAFGLPKYVVSSRVHSVLGLQNANAVSKISFSGNPVIVATTATQTAVINSNIVANNTTIATNSTAIASNNTTIASNNTAIVANNTAIVANDTTIATQTAQIETNTANIDTFVKIKNNAEIRGWPVANLPDVSAVYNRCYKDNGTKIVKCVSNTYAANFTFVNGNTGFIINFSTMLTVNASLPCGTGPCSFDYNASRGTCATNEVDVCILDTTANNLSITTGGTLGQGLAKIAQIPVLTAQNITLNNQKNDLITANNNLNTQINTATNTINTLTAQNDTLNTQINTATASNIALNTQLAALSNPNIYLKMSINTATNPSISDTSNSAMWDLRTVNSTTQTYPYEASNLPVIVGKKLLIARNASTNNIDSTDFNNIAIAPANDKLAGFSASFSQKLDTKFDDGKPYTGNIIAGKNVADLANTSGCTTANLANFAAVTSNLNAGYVNGKSLDGGCVVGFVIRT